MAETTVIYHNDLDGRCCAAIAAKVLCDKDGREVRFIETDYDRLPDIDSLKGDIFLLDLNVPLEWLRVLRSHVLVIRTRLHFVDHHKGCEEKAAEARVEYGIWKTHWDSEWPPLDQPNNIAESGPAGMEKGDKVSAAFLSWLYFHTAKEPIPEVVWLVDDWDTFKHKSSKSTLFKYGMDSVDAAPNGELWRRMLHGDEAVVHQVINAGETVLCYITRRNEEYIAACGWPDMWEGHSCYFCNAGLASSQLFDCVRVPAQILVAYVYTSARKWKVSLYSDGADGPDVSKIAKKYGGGGHEGAAGFLCDRLPWEQGGGWAQ